MPFDGDRAFFVVFDYTANCLVASQTNPLVITYSYPNRTKRGWSVASAKIVGGGTTYNYSNVFRIQDHVDGHDPLVLGQAYLAFEYTRANNVVPNFPKRYKDILFDAINNGATIKIEIANGDSSSGRTVDVHMRALKTLDYSLDLVGGVLRGVPANTPNWPVVGGNPVTDYRLFSETFETLNNPCDTGADGSIVMNVSPPPTAPVSFDIRFKHKLGTTPEFESVFDGTDMNEFDSPVATGDSQPEITHMAIPLIGAFPLDYSGSTNENTV